MRLFTGTVLPLVLAFGAVLVVLIAARRPAARTVPARPVATLLSIAASGCAVFAAAMGLYCFAQPHSPARCFRVAVVEAIVLAALVGVPATVLTLLASRRSRPRA